MTTPLKTLVHQWRDLTAQMLPLCLPDALELATLPASEVERLRIDADMLGALLGTWQLLHRTAASTTTPNTGA